MDCDQVFFVLTSGPFPSGSPHDLQVEQHLGRCRACREIAEALRPAGDVFQEALPPAEAQGLPGYWGSTPTPALISQHVGRDSRGASSRPKGSRSPELATPSRVRAMASRARQAEPLPIRQARSSAWQDLAQLAGFLTMVTTAAVGLSWFFG